MTVHFLHEIPEYEKIDRLYMEEERQLWNYWDECKEKAFRMFTDWFWNLWDQIIYGQKKPLAFREAFTVPG